MKISRTWKETERMSVLPRSLWPVRHLAPWRFAEAFLEQLGDLAARTLTDAIDAKRQLGDEDDQKDADKLSDVVDAIIVVEALSNVNSHHSLHVKSAAIRLMFKFDLRDVPDIGRIIISSEGFVSKIFGLRPTGHMSDVDSANAKSKPPSYIRERTGTVFGVPNAEFRPSLEKLKHRRY